MGPVRVLKVRVRRRGVSVSMRRSPVVAGCLGLVAVAVVAASGSPARGISLRPAAVVARFDPVSVTFVSLDRGWVLGTARCSTAGGCLALRETADGGHSWSERPLPASLVTAVDESRARGVSNDLAENPAAQLNVRFADPRDGWIYGGLIVPSTVRSGGRSVAIKAILWSTHDGGLTWRTQPLRGLDSQNQIIFDLEAAAGRAYLMQTNTANGVTVKSSRVSRDSWDASNTVTLGSPAGGGEQSGAFVLAGSSGWLVEGNDRGTTGSARLASDGKWVSWTPPCAAVGHSFAIPAASTPENLVAACVMGGFAYPLSKSAPPGATLGSSWLYLSDDGGRTFTAGPELGGPAYSSGGILASPSPGVIVMGHVDQNGQQNVIASFDGGVKWTVVYRGPALFLGFTSPSQGVAIMRSTNATNTMIMSFDGGHHWAPVTL